jgi:hypothetical protein
MAQPWMFMMMIITYKINRLFVAAVKYNFFFSFPYFNVTKIRKNKKNNYIVCLTAAITKLFILYKRYHLENTTLQCLNGGTR